MAEADVVFTATLSHLKISHWPLTPPAPASIWAILHLPGPGYCAEPRSAATTPMSRRRGGEMKRYIC